MNIEGVGGKLVKALLDNGLIHDASDLYYISKEEIASLERMGEKSAENFVKAIEGSKNMGLGRLIYALGIRHIGEVASSELAGKFGNIDALFEATEEEIKEIGDFGDVMAKSVVDFFKKEETKYIVEKLKNAGVKTSEEIKELSNEFEGLTFVVELFVKRCELAVGSKIVIFIVASYKEDIKSGLFKRNFSAVFEHAKNIVTGNNVLGNLSGTFGGFIFFLLFGVVLLCKAICFNFGILVFNELLVFVFIYHDKFEDYAQTVEQNTVKSKFYLSDSLRCSFFIFDGVEGINFCFYILKDKFA
jgi:hypothetical protein